MHFVRKVQLESKNPFILQEDSRSGMEDLYLTRLFENHIIVRKLTIY